MIFDKIVLFSCLILFVSGGGGEKTNTTKEPNPPKPSPTVIKNFKSFATAPHYDTTLVSPYIRSIFQDSKGNLRFGTIDECVVRYDEKTLTTFFRSDDFLSHCVFAVLILSEFTNDL